MDFSMVNSNSFGSERNGNTKASCMQANTLHTKTQSSSPLTASSATQSKTDFTETPDSVQLCKSDAVEPTPSQTDFDIHENSRILSESVSEEKKSLFCSVPLEKVQTVLTKYTLIKGDGNKVKSPRKVLCLYCDRTFVNINLRHKHVERCHSSKQLRRVSLRKHQNVLTSTPCTYCDKFGSAEHTLKDLFKHLVENHGNKYFGCLVCEDRFLHFSHLADHNALHHNLITIDEEADSKETPTHFGGIPSSQEQETKEEIPIKVTRRKVRAKNENKDKIGSNVEETLKPTNIKNLRSRKLSVKTSKMIIKRSKRLQAKVTEPRKKRTKGDERKKGDKQEPIYSTKLSEKSTKTTSNFINPYPEFDNFFQVKKITDHSIDNLKISSLTFDDVFDKAFFNRIKCNIQENLLHHIDGKLFKNEESETRISNFEKNANIPQELQNLNTENYGCELSLNAIAPTTMLLSNQLGDDPESQIEYGSKPSKKKPQIKKDEVHYKYFTRRKYQASILEHKENRDLSKLDMWTQYVIKNRQQKILDDKKSPKEILDYFSGEEYKSIMRREELNRILDRRGPFEDLREEVSKQAALDKMNGETNLIDDDNIAEIGELLNEILNRVFELAKENNNSVEAVAHKNMTDLAETHISQIPSYLNLRPNTGSATENEIDRSDKIALICSSQETENFEHPSNTVRGKNEKVELTGEWARSRIFVCAACGLKLQNIKQFLEHKSASHQYIWVQHYEFVGNQSELYRHLSIPVLGKVGVLENVVQSKVWKRSDARLCTKCGKQCNSLGELHRHILECGGDWTWMLARKKCKYRPFGAKSRRKRRGLVKRRIYTQKTEPSEKKIYKKYDIPRQKPSDADTIKRMLANLPPKRATRKIICLKDGFNSPRNKKMTTTKKSKFKCVKVVHTKTKEQNKITKPEYDKTNKNQSNNHRRSLRCLNKVLTSRILDTKSSIIVRRKYSRRRKNGPIKENNDAVDNSQTEVTTNVLEEIPVKVSLKKIKSTTPIVTLEVQEDTPSPQPAEEIKFKRSSPRTVKTLEFNGITDKMNIKRFFPVKKKKKTTVDNEKNKEDSQNSATILPKRRNGKVNETAPAPKTRVRRGLKINNEETNNGQLVKTEKNLNRRKRKIDNTESVISDENNEQKISLIPQTRKIRRRGRKPRVLPDNTSIKEANLTQTEVKDFFEKVIPQDTPDPAVGEVVDEETIASNLEINQDQTFFPGGEEPKSEEQPQPSENNTPVKANDKVLVSPQTSSPERPKRKMRKPIRGLNDCIAMLTSKLGIGESVTHNIFNDISSQNKENCVEERKEKDDFILKVPFSNEHFKLHYAPKDTKIGDSSKIEDMRAIDVDQSQNSSTEEQPGDKEDDMEILPNLYPNGEEIYKDRRDVIEETTEHLNSPEIINKDFCPELGVEETENISERSEEVEMPVLDKEDCIFPEQSTDSVMSSGGLSEDEIPLSTLATEDSNDRPLSPKIDKSDLSDKLGQIVAKSLETSSTANAERENKEVGEEISNSTEVFYEKTNDSIAAVSKKFDSSFTKDEMIFKPNTRNSEMSVVQVNHIREEISIFKEKDGTVLTEINDNLCEQNESTNYANALDNIIEKMEVKSRKSVENKLNDSSFVAEVAFKVNSVTNVTNIIGGPVHDNRDEVEKMLSLDKLNFLIKNNLDKNNGSFASLEEKIVNNDLNVEEISSVDDSSESKENSVSVVDEAPIKPRSRKKITTGRRNNKNNKIEPLSSQSPKEIDVPKVNTDRKRVRTAKVRALEYILDDALSELSESENFGHKGLAIKSGDVELVVKEKTVKITKEVPFIPTKHSVDPAGSTTDISERDTSQILENESENITVEQKVNSVLPEISEEVGNSEKTESENVKELRRSRRNSKKLSSYNESDFVDPLLDHLEHDRTISKIIKETTEDIFGIKRKSRKLSNKKVAKNGHNERKFNGDELFDLLKATPNENIVLSKPSNTFFNSFDEISNDFNDDNFDVFEDILERSIAVIEENLSERTVPTLTENFSNDQNLEKNTSDVKVQPVRADNKKKRRGKKSKLKNVEQAEVKLNLFEKQDLLLSDVESRSNLELVDNLVSSNQGDFVKNNIENDKIKAIYCEICEKSFSRMESLSKHKRTLTHISKLSELEAKEAAMKKKKEELDESSQNEETTGNPAEPGKNLNLLDILDNVETEEAKQFSSPFSVNVNNSNLKLADIINDVLNKPILKNDNDHSFSEIIMQNESEVQPEIRRYKSLAERKSFESSENCLEATQNDYVKTVDYFEPEINNAAAGTILEKQITLLENIIENRSSLSYIDELTVSSTESVMENRLNPNDSSLKQEDSLPTCSEECRQDNIVEPTTKESFLKPSQCEEISEDSSNLRNYDEQKMRKVLNRDEELFLECCSLLKSGSEVSNFSKKSNPLSKINHELKPSEERDWLENNCSSRKNTNYFAESYSDNSRVRTPLGDSFSQDDTNSNTFSSHWDINSSNTASRNKWKKDLEVKENNLSFGEVFNYSKEENVFGDEQAKNANAGNSPFGVITSEVLNSDQSCSSDEDLRIRSPKSSEESLKVSDNLEDFKDTSFNDGKKMLTKGAKKVFEGLRVSIPTEELSIDKILTTGSPTKTSMSHISDFSDLKVEEDKREKPIKTAKRNSQKNSALKAKMKNQLKSMATKKQTNMQINSKAHDIYDFEETQDNSDVFTKPDFRSFRTNYEKTKKTEKIEGSDDDSRDCADAISVDAFSSSSTSVSEQLPKKTKTQQNITKKKCMIMGRIFKNAVKSRDIDEDIRSIPILDNTKLVEDFVLSCPEPVIDPVEKKTKMTEEEMNLVFDNLLNNKTNEPKTNTINKPSSPDKLHPKNTTNRRKGKIKSRKRVHAGSDSSDDEFKLQRSTKKRTKKKSNSEESCINLEQELRECIGVASRKSQRKCTSGKQNVLMEYWSSDESAFESLLETQIIEPVQNISSATDEVIHIEKEPEEKELQSKVDAVEDSVDISVKIANQPCHKKGKMSPAFYNVNRRKRAAVNPLYHWSSSSEDESRDLIEVRPIRDEIEDDEDRPIQHGWIVGDSPKKLVTMLAQAKGKKCEVDSVKEHGKRRTSTFS